MTGSTIPMISACLTTATLFVAGAAIAAYELYNESRYVPRHMAAG